MSRWGDVFCYEASSGKIIWKKNVQKESGANIPDWGFAGSPLVLEGLVILNVGAAGMASRQGDRQTLWQSGPEKRGLLHAAAASRAAPGDRAGSSSLIGSGKS